MGSGGALTLWSPSNKASVQLSVISYQLSEEEEEEESSDADR